MTKDNIRSLENFAVAIATGLAVGIAFVLASLAINNYLHGPYEPDVCRAVGVHVPDGAQVTGEVRTEAALDYMALQVVCGLDEPVLGCARQVTGTNKWDVYYLPIEQIMVHERCHAQYQTIEHNYQ
jgi:hypothetical protein